MNQYIVVQFLDKLFILLREEKRMSVFSELFNDITGWLAINVIVFILVMMACLFSLFISKSAKGKK
jgi:hypothetical protein